LPSLDPPVPIAAEYNTIFGQGLVTFSMPLNHAVVDGANWFVRTNNQEYAIHTAEAGIPLVDQVFIRGGLVGPNPGPNVVSFSPPPFDVTAGPRNVPAPAFADFPLT
jgi:hypothetical protein